MEKFVVLAAFVTVCSAVFFPFISLPNSRQSMMNVCIYSVNPAMYQPKCFLCPTTVYPNVLQTCVNAATIPRNVTYTQAACLEQNCAIGRGKRSVAVGSENSLESDPSKQNSFGEVELDQLTPLEKASLSYDSSHQGNNQAFEIVGEEEAYASDDEEEGDYEDMTD